MQKKIIFRSAIWTGLILLIPLIGTLLHNFYGIGGWDWKPGGFIVMGILIFVTGLALGFASRLITNRLYRVISYIIIVTAFLCIWVELAVDGVSQLIKLIFG